jgi:tetratricopeptide (TPR) repeat protein
MPQTRSDLVQKVFAVIDWGDTLQGLIALEGEPSLLEIPAASSYLAYCKAKERGQYREAIHMCEAALKAEPHNPAHYLNLGRIFVLTRHKAKAMETFRKGLSGDAVTGSAPAAESTPETRAKQQALILAEMRRLGIRRRPPFSSLPRDHALNRVAGKVLAKLQMR